MKFEMVTSDKSIFDVFEKVFNSSEHNTFMRSMCKRDYTPDSTVVNKKPLCALQIKSSIFDYLYCKLFLATHKTDNYTIKAGWRTWKQLKNYEEP